MKNKAANFIAFDVGSNKIAALATSLGNIQQSRIVAQTIHHSAGFKAGCVTNLEQAENSIIRAAYALEKSCDQTIKKASISLSGCGAKSYYLTQTIKLGTQPINKNDIKRLIVKALQDFKLENRQIIHYFPIEYIIDDENIVENPIDMYGTSLSCELHIVTANSTLVRNIVSCFSRCHIEIANITTSIYSSSIACLTVDEKEQGAIIIDIGSHTTGYGVYLKNNLIYLNYIAAGGSHITDDIAKFFSVSNTIAEKIKILHGKALSNNTDNDNPIKIEDLEQDNEFIDERIISSTQLNSLINHRMSSIFVEIQKACAELSLDKYIARRVVITGGGAALAEIKELASHIFQKQVRIGKAENLFGFAQDSNPYIYSASIGMVKQEVDKFKKKATNPDIKENKGFVRKAISWIKENI